MTDKINRAVISIYVDNQANVLSRIIGLYGRRGFNIDSLTVSATTDPLVSRITVVVKGARQALDQILSQTEKLEVVKRSFVLESEDSIFRELLMMKVAYEANDLARIKDIVEVFRGKIVDLSKDSMVIELTGEPAKIDGFIAMMEGYHISEVCRTGITGMERALNPANENL